MTEKAKQILQNALSLSEEERAEIARSLLESLEPPEDAAIDAAWREEVRNRLELLNKGSLATVPWSQVRDQLLSRLRGS